MSKLVRIPDDTISLLNGIKKDKTYGEVIRELVTNELTVNNSDIKEILRKLDLLQNSIQNLKNY